MAKKVKKAKLKIGFPKILWIGVMMFLDDAIKFDECRHMNSTRDHARLYNDGEDDCDEDDEEEQNPHVKKKRRPDDKPEPMGQRIVQISPSRIVVEERSGRDSMGRIIWIKSNNYVTAQILAWILIQQFHDKEVGIQQ